MEPTTKLIEPKKIYEEIGNIRNDVIKFRLFIKNNKSYLEKNKTICNNFLMANIDRFINLMLKWKKYAEQG